MIAIAGMGDVDDTNAVFLADFGGAAKICGSRLRGTTPSERNQLGLKPADGSAGGFSALPEPFALLGRGRLDHLAGADCRHSSTIRVPLPFQPNGRPSTSTISTAPASGGKPKWNASSTATRIRDPSTPGPRESRRRQ